MCRVAHIAGACSMFTPSLPPMPYICSSARNLGIAVLFFTAVIVSAETRTVTTADDDVATPPAGSLRKAIADAGDGDTIEFQAGLTGAITLAGTELLLDKNLTITGPGAALLAISGNQQSRVFRVSAGKTVSISGLAIRDGKASNGTDLFLRLGGTAPDGQSGGGIYNEGLLTLANCRITNNSAGRGGNFSADYNAHAGNGGSGGAILNAGGLILTNCQLDHNHAGSGGSATALGATAGIGGHGGAIHSLAGGGIELLNCTLSENAAGDGGLCSGGISQCGRGGDGGAVSVTGATAVLEGCSLVRCTAGDGGAFDTSFPGVGVPGPGGSGGGIYIGFGTVTLKTSTISGNGAGNVAPSTVKAGDGGGIACLGGTANLISCTISDNIAGENLYYDPTFGGRGGGLYSNGGTVTIGNSIVAQNRNTFYLSISPFPAPYADFFGTFVDGGHNLIGSDSMLAPLDEYGGPTPTHALLAGSPAIDAGDDSITGTDQRGQPRLLGSHVDIGSFEGIVPNVLSFAVESVEVDETVGTVTITVQRAGDTASSASATFSMLPGTATEPDYSAVSGTLEFVPGQTQAVIQVPIIDDSTPESPETFQIRLASSSPNTAIFPRGLQTVTIFDNEGPAVLSFTTASTTIAEAGGNALISVQRKNDGAVGTVSVNYSTATAVDPIAPPPPNPASGNDYTSVSGTLIFGPGIKQQTFVVPILDDAQFEGDETFYVQLSGPSGGAILGTQKSQVIIIANDDPAPPPPPTPTFDFEVAASSVSESNGNILIKVIRSKEWSGAVSVSYQTSAGTAAANADFTPASGTLNFPSSSTQQTIVVPITNDDSVEGAETFTVTLSNPANGAVLGTLTTHTVTINDDDGPTTIAFSGASTSVGESSGQTIVTLIRSGNATSTATVEVSASGGSANNGLDYFFQAKTITFAPGVTEQPVTVPVTDDSLEEGDEDFALTLSNPGGGATLGAQTVHTITILDDTGDVPEIRKASYRGLVTSTDEQAPEFGAIAVSTTDSGQLTGSLQIRGKTLRLKGRLSETGTFSHEFSQASFGNLAGSSIQLQLAEGGAVLNGTFQHFGGASLQVEAKREVAGTRSNPLAEANAYTAVLQTQLAANPAGFLRARVLPTGKVTLLGMLPDGTRLSASSHLTEGRNFPIFFPAYARKLGYLAGTAEIDQANAVSISGDLHWQKSADSRPPYAGGLTNEPVELSGNVYTPPHRQRILDDFDATQGIAFFQTSTAADPNPVSINAMWNQDNTIRILPPEFRRPRSPIRFSLQPKTGLFTGMFRDAENHSSKFFGICIQQAEAGADQAVGFFRDGETAGRIELVPQPPQQ